MSDELSVSKQQMDEHYLSPEFEIKNYVGDIIFKGYKTNPYKKCLSDKNNLIDCSIYAL